MYSRISSVSWPTVENEVSPRPEALPYEIPLPFSIHTGQVYRALALDVSDHLRHGVLWRDRNHHMHMTWHKMTFFDPGFLLQRQPPEYLLPQLRIQRFSPTLGNEYDMVFALPLRMA